MHDSRDVGERRRRLYRCDRCKNSFSTVEEIVAINNPQGGRRSLLAEYEQMRMSKVKDMLREALLKALEDV